MGSDDVGGDGARAQGFADNMTVQGVMMNRLENNLNRLEGVVAENSAAIARNTESIAKLPDGMMVMQAAMQRLFDHMDRFIRGLERDGRESDEV